MTQNISNVRMIVCPYSPIKARILSFIIGILY